MISTITSSIKNFMLTLCKEINLRDFNEINNQNGAVLL